MTRTTEHLVIDNGPLAAAGWLIFVLGIAIIAIAAFSKGARVRSPTRRIADCLTGGVLCLLALLLIMPNLERPTRLAVAISAALAMGASWYLGRHARKVDRMARREKRR